MEFKKKVSPFSRPPPTAPPPHEDHPNIFGWPGKATTYTLIHRCSLSALVSSIFHVPSVSSFQVGRDDKCMAVSGKTPTAKGVTTTPYTKNICEVHQQLASLLLLIAKTHSPLSQDNYKLQQTSCGNSGSSSTTPPPWPTHPQ